MKTGYFQVNGPITLNWDIVYNETLVDRGFIKLGNLLDLETQLVGDEDDARSHNTLVIESAGNWEWALPVLIDSLELYDPVDAPFSAVPVPSYQTASFWFNGPIQHHDIWWGLRNFGFGHFVLQTQGGYPTLSNECMSKNSIYRVFEHIEFARTST